MMPSFDDLPTLTATLIERVASLEALLGQIMEKVGIDTGSPEKLLYTRVEVQKMLGISKPTMFKIEKKELPYFFIGNERRYRKADVEKYITNQIKKTSGI